MIFKSNKLFDRFSYGKFLFTLQEINENLKS